MVTINGTLSNIMLNYLAGLFISASFVYFYHRFVTIFAVLPFVFMVSSTSVIIFVFTDNTTRNLNIKYFILKPQWIILRLLSKYFYLHAPMTHQNLLLDSESTQTVNLSHFVKVIICTLNFFANNSTNFHHLLCTFLP